MCVGVYWNDISVLVENYSNKSAFVAMSFFGVPSTHTLTLQ
jgi:hypothetical protein